MLANFQQQFIQTSQAKINTYVGGSGYPLLLLHGYPQNYYMWHKICDRLAEDFTVVVTDLRGYGDSQKFPVTPDHQHYSKRVMAQDQLEVMAHLGFDDFYVVGHDRGGRVAYRLALDYPQAVTKLALLDILPTYELYQRCDRELATAYYHWFWLIQPAPFPETLIGGKAEYFLRHYLNDWSEVPNSFEKSAMQEYLRCFCKQETIASTCEDYRAAASIDLVHDKADINQALNCPLLILWGSKSVIGQQYNVLEFWQDKAKQVQGKEILCGHFLPEEAPNPTYKTMKDFFLG